MSVLPKPTRVIILLLAIAVVSACSPEMVSRDTHSVTPLVFFPDAHDFYLPWM